MPTFLNIFRESMHSIAQSIIRNIHAQDEVLPEVLAMLANCKGKIIVSGIGKSAIIGHKIAATMTSVGCPAIFLHAGEAFHGDLGICLKGDVALIISKSGTTSELISLVPTLKKRGIQIIGILGNTISPLGKICDYVLDASVEHEADEHDIVPTASTSVALAIGDALALTLMKMKNFGPEDFAIHHSGGQIGKNLLHKVSDHMHPLTRVAVASEDTPLKQVIISMTEKPLGAACVIDSQQQLLGVITDGDIRRYLVSHDDILNTRAGDIMTQTPVSISPDENILQAIQLMENRNSKISVLPVVQNEILSGIIRLHDVY